MESKRQSDTTFEGMMSQEVDLHGCTALNYM